MAGEIARAESVNRRFDVVYSRQVSRIGRDVSAGQLAGAAVRSGSRGAGKFAQDEGGYYGKSSKRWFFGFKLYVLATQTGQILGAVMTSGNVDDRDGARVVAQSLDEEAICIADLGYRGAAFQDEMFEEEVLFVTRADITDKELKAIHSTIGERVETVFSQLWSRFATRVRSRFWLGLWNTLQLKM